MLGQYLILHALKKPFNFISFTYNSLYMIIPDVHQLIISYFDAVVMFNFFSLNVIMR